MTFCRKLSSLHHLPGQMRLGELSRCQLSFDTRGVCTGETSIIMLAACLVITGHAAAVFFTLSAATGNNCRTQQAAQPYKSSVGVASSQCPVIYPEYAWGVSKAGGAIRTTSRTNTSSPVGMHSMREIGSSTLPPVSNAI